MSILVALARLFRLALFSLTALAGLGLAGLGMMGLDLTITTGEAGWAGPAIAALTVILGGLLALAAGHRLHEIRESRDELIF